MVGMVLHGRAGVVISSKTLYDTYMAFECYEMANTWLNGNVSSYLGLLLTIFYLSTIKERNQEHRVKENYLTESAENSF